MDVEGAEEKLKAFKKHLKKKTIIPISAMNHQNLDMLKYEILNTLKVTPKIEVKVDEKVYTYNEKKESDFIIKKGDDGIFDITGDKLYRLFTRIDFNNESAVKRFARQLRSLGVDEALKMLELNTGIQLESLITSLNILNKRKRS